MFSVDYATLKQVMKQFLYTGIFRAPVANVRLLPGEGYIELQVKEGIAIACRFVTKQGETYRIEQWDVHLAQLGVLNWELTPSPEPAPQQRASASRPFSSAKLEDVAERETSPPRHSATLLPSQIRQLPLLYRQVYSLINGRRQASDIANLLYKPPREIAQIIDELRRQRLVE